MKEMTMLDVADIDLATLAEALEDHSGDTEWWFDPRSGEVEPRPSEHSLDQDGQDHPDEDALVMVYPLASGIGYRDMEDFVSRVRDPSARELLRRAIEGRGAFRRFKDTLFGFPDLREAWFAFHDSRAERRALEWLSQEGVIDPEVAERETALRPDPEHPSLGEILDPEDVARAVGTDLRELYGDRLRQVVLFGSWARRDAHPESDIDVLIVLDRVDSAWEELRRMDAVLWRHSVANDTLVSATPVSEDDLADGRWPLLRRVRAEGLQVA